MDERDQRRRELSVRLKRYRRLTPFVTDQETLKQIRELEAEIMAELRELGVE